jgi:hypothetical protein
MPKYIDCISTSKKPNSEVLEQLRLSRLRRQEDVREIMACRTPKEKRDLVDKWKRERHPHTVTELLEVARTPSCWNKILAWDVDNFGKSNNGTVDRKKR